MAMPQITPAQGEWTAEAAVESLGDILKPFVGDKRLGVLLRVGADLRPRTKTVVQPDVFVAPLKDGRRPKSWQDMTHLLLAVEVLSTRTAARDRGVKRRLYQQCADEYWIVDLDARLIERWRPRDERPEILDEKVSWQPAGAADGLTIDLPEFFKDVWDE